MNIPIEWCALHDGNPAPVRRCKICKVVLRTQVCAEDYCADHAGAHPTTPVLATDPQERKNTPIFSGFLNYFPLAVAAVARLSKRGNDKHNPGQPLHWSRDKSGDHADCIARHLIDYETINPVSGEYEDAVETAWRAMALLEILEEKRLGKPISRGSK